MKFYIWKLNGILVMWEPLPLSLLKSLRDTFAEYNKLALGHENRSSDRKWEMENGKWEMGNEKCEMGHGNRVDGMRYSPIHRIWLFASMNPKPANPIQYFFSCLY